MRHLDLFTGILGFSYAAEKVWQGDYELVACCEIDKFCQKVIRKHQPNIEIVNDIRDDRIKRFRDIDLLTAGVPCQPASVAGKKRGTDDERWLWSETLAVIGAVRPRWALLENVPGLFSLENGSAFNGILSGLAEIGYDCWWETIPACAVGACHRRDIIWIVAYSTSNGWRNGGYTQTSILEGQQSSNKIEQGNRGTSQVGGNDNVSIVTNGKSGEIRRRNRRMEKIQENVEIVTDTERQ